MSSSTSDPEASALLSNHDKNASTTMMQGSSQLHMGLKSMEESLSCVVCRDIFRNPISLYPCQHSFCSECVRKSLKEQLKSLKRTANCPVCRVQLDTTGTAFEKCIRPNPTLEDLSKSYSKIRNELYSVLSSSSPQISLLTVPATAAATSEQETLRRSSRRCSESEHTTSTQSPETSLPPLSAPSKQQRRLTKKNPVLYSSFKKKQLQELCRKEGLATHGSDTELKLRHQAFVELYNAECDSSTPRTHAELIQDFANREQQRRLVECRDRQTGAHEHAAQVERFFQQRNGLTSMRGNSEFEQEWKDGWKRLIAIGKEQLEKERKIKEKALAICEKKSDGPEENADKNDNGVEQPMNIDVSVAKNCSPLNVNKSSDVTQGDGPKSVKKGPETTKLMACASALSNGMPDAVESHERTTLGRDNQENQQDGHILASSSKPVASATSRMKKRPFELMCPRSSATSVSDLSPSGMQITIPNNDSSDYLPPPKQPKTYQAPSATRSSTRSIVGQWTCQRCTYFNANRTWSTAKCEMCELPRQSSVQTQELITLN